MPTEGLLNVDPDEGSARIFDNTVMNYIIRIFGEYYKHLVTNAPERYFHGMVSNREGRSDLDGICPHNPLHQDRSSNHQRPRSCARGAIGKLDLIQSPSTSGSGLIREWDQMPTIVNVAIRLEKVMEFLVQAGFTPD